MSCDRCKDGVLDTAAVAERLGLKLESVTRARHRQSIAVPPEDGVVSGRPWWWPETVDGWPKRSAKP